MYTYNMYIFLPAAADGPSATETSKIMSKTKMFKICLNMQNICI